MHVTKDPLRPKLLGSPASVGSRAVVECIPKPPGLGRVAQIRLFHRVGHNNDQTEVFARDRIVEVIRFRAELEVLVVIGLLCGPSGRWVLERAWHC
jgi:hypothetical protein